MKITELLESLTESAHTVIQRRIAKIQLYRKNFNSFVNAKGVEKTVKEINEYLKVDDFVELILTNLIETNRKFNKLYQKYQSEKTALERILQTGIADE